jgi:hypothetical protein
MAYLVGFLLALGIGQAARVTGIDRKRGFYPLVLGVVGSFYVLFAVMCGVAGVLGAEIGLMAVFVALAAAGLRLSPWWIVAGLAAHGTIDAVHGMLIHNHGVPAWWPAFCGTYDLTAAAMLAVMLRADGPTHACA